MGLPPRVYYTLQEAAARWDCNLADIAGWASVGRFDIVTAIAPIFTDTQVLAGLVVVPIPDILLMFRRHGTGTSSSRLVRVRPLDQDEWFMVPGTAEPIDVAIDDLLIMADQARRFEDECDLLRRPASNIGSTTRYDWDAMYIALIQRVHDRGVPETQAEWVGEVQDWFVSASETGEVPDERTIRRRLSPIWKALRASA